MPRREGVREGRTRGGADWRGGDRETGMKRRLDWKKRDTEGEFFEGGRRLEWWLLRDWSEEKVGLEQGILEEKFLKEEEEWSEEDWRGGNWETGVKRKLDWKRGKRRKRLKWEVLERRAIGMEKKEIGE